MVCPFSEIVIASIDFVANLLDTVDVLLIIVCDQPIPERWAEIHAVMKVVRLNKYIRNKQVTHQSATPN